MGYNTYICFPCVGVPLRLHALDSMPTLTWSSTHTPERTEQLEKISTFWAKATPAELSDFLFEERGDDVGRKYSSGLRAMKSWFTFQFPLEAVDDLVEIDTKPSIRDCVGAARSGVESALHVMADAQRLNEDLFLNMAKAASSAQHMLDQIRKSYGTLDPIANKKKALTEKWLVEEKNKLRETAIEATKSAQAAKWCAAEAMHGMWKIPSSAWGPVLHHKMHEWLELEATEEAARVAKLQAAAASVKGRVRESATPQKHGRSLPADADLEAGAMLHFMFKLRLRGPYLLLLLPLCYCFTLHQLYLQLHLRSSSFRE